MCEGAGVAEGVAEGIRERMAGSGGSLLRLDVVRDEEGGGKGDMFSQM